MRGSCATETLSVLAIVSTTGSRRWQLVGGGLTARTAALLLALALVRPASAANILINNGLAPPDPANVIDAADGLTVADTVFVQNAGCDATVEDPCPTPGASTRVELADGGLAGELVVRESSGVVMTGGAVVGVVAADASSFGVAAGLVPGFVMASGSAGVSIAGGDVLGLQASDIASVELSGGSVDILGATDSSRVVMTGGTVQNSFGLDGSARATVGGGAVDTTLVAVGDSLVRISGGSMFGLVADGDADIRLNGATIGSDITVAGNATATVRGGILLGDVRVVAAAAVEIGGSGFAVDGTPVPFGSIVPITGVLTGTLASGDPLAVAFQRDTLAGTTGTIFLVLEPSGLSLLAGGLGVALLGIRPARRS